MAEQPTLYGLPGCDACRRARAWLEARGTAYRFHDVRVHGLDPALLTRACAALGWEVVLNRRSTTWRGLPAGEREVSDCAGAVALIARHPTLLKRPLLDTGAALCAGFDASAWARALSGPT